MIITISSCESAFSKHESAFFQFLNLKFQDVCLSFQVINLCLLRNKFYIWKVHGIMNTSGLLQSK